MSILPDICVTVSDNISGLIQVYQICEFNVIFNKSSDKIWYIWSQNGWTRIRKITETEINKDNVITEIGNPSDLHINIDEYKKTNIDKIKRTKFMAIHNNTNILFCSENTNLSHKNYDKNKQEINTLMNKVMIVDNMIKIILSYIYPISITAYNFQKTKENVLLNVPFPNTGIIKKDIILENECKIARNELYGFDNRCEMFGYTMCDECNEIFEPHEKVNYYGSKTNDCIYCDKCIKHKINEYTRELYQKKNIFHAFHWLTSIKTSSNNALYLMKMFKNLDDRGIYKSRDYQNFTIAQMIMMIGKKLNYKYLSFHLANGGDPWIDLGCTRKLIKFFKNNDDYYADGKYKEIYKCRVKEYKTNKKMKVMYFLLNSTEEYIYVPYFDRTEIDFTEDRKRMLPVHHYKLPINVYNIETVNGSWQAGVGGLTIYG
ncbi:MAG: hypothetical protein Edafosvirus12_18 [Edafosvirus sp.]|uniref:Uncharacterized protein n=1 Tax=Edafosvirus sp. TaxID=2487765 RepID=A0A3G4ZYE0_9VIRU|nr:MAG: hypothetical protein Edafosvirus12_18 [Edafosvirus sp.]